MALNSRVHTTITILLALLFCGVLFWTFSVKDDLKESQAELATSKTYAQSLVANIEKTRQMMIAQSVTYVAQVDSLKKENTLLTLKLSGYAKTSADIHKKYDKIYTKIDLTDDFDQQLKYNQDLLAIHGQLYHPKR